MRRAPRAALRAARQAKHAAWVLKRKIPRGADAIRRYVSSRSSHGYSADAYTKQVFDVTMPNSSTFLVNHLAFDAPPDHRPVEKAPDQLFAIWSGPNELTEPRRVSLETIRSANPDVEIKLVTPDNIDDYVVDGHPLHRAYNLLSYVHRSDYLRAYLMHHHGGAYSDIKPMSRPWAPVIARLNASSGAWAGGPAEKTSFNVSPASGLLGRHQQLHFASLLYPAAFAFRPRSAWTQEWLSEVERRLNYFEPLLAIRPPDQPLGHNKEYPIPWNAILGQVFSPLSLKYRAHSFVVPEMRFIPLIGGYR